MIAKEVENMVMRVLELLRKEPNPQNKILQSTAYWVPLSLLYDQLVKDRELIKIGELPDDQREHYKRLVKPLSKEISTKVMIAQALYMYDKIIQTNKA